MLLKDNQGTHLIQKIINKFEDDKVTYVFNLILNNFDAITNASGGVCVLKELMKKFKEKNKNEEVRILLAAILQKLDFIIQNPFGNYVIQYAIEVNLNFLSVFQYDLYLKMCVG